MDTKCFMVLSIHVCVCVLTCVIIDLNYRDVGMASISNEIESLGEMVEFANK